MRLASSQSGNATLSIVLTLEYIDGETIRVVWDDRANHFRLVSVDGRRLATRFWNLAAARGIARVNTATVRNPEILGGAYLAFEESSDSLYVGKMVMICSEASHALNQTHIWRSPIASIRIVPTTNARSDPPAPPA